MRTIDGSSHAGSGSIVRQAVALAALAGEPVHVVNARARRPRPGLGHQHLRAVEAVCALTGGTLEGAQIGAREFTFRPGHPPSAAAYRWDVGTAGSVTTLAQALLPVLAFHPHAVGIELTGGVFQDFAPSVFHTEHVMLRLLARMGLDARVELLRPGYVPRGAGLVRLYVTPVAESLRPLELPRAGGVERIWGIALASHLGQRRVGVRMAESALAELGTRGRDASIDVRDDTLSLQPGAALALFADLEGGARLGADRAGAPRRTAESIGRYVVRQLVAAIDAGATLDRFAADQLIPYAALADGETRVRIVEVTPHVETAAWLAREFLDAEVRVRDHELIIRGCGHRRRRTPVDDGPAASAGAAGEAPPRGPGGDPEGGHST